MPARDIPCPGNRNCGQSRQGPGRRARQQYERPLRGQRLGRRRCPTPECDPHPNPSLSAPALALRLGRSPAREPVARKRAASPRERERGDGAGQASLRLEARVTRAGRGLAFGFFRGRSRPISRVLSWTVIPLGAVSPRRSSNLPGPDAGRAMRSLFGLAPGGVCRAGPLPDSRCALTAPFHPCLIRPRRAGHRRYLSVALSVGSRRPGVTWHRALWSPDFPRRRTTEVVPTTRLSGRLRRAHSLTPPAAARATDVDMAPPGAGDRGGGLAPATTIGRVPLRDAGVASHDRDCGTGLDVARGERLARRPLPLADRDLMGGIAQPSEVPVP